VCSPTDRCYISSERAFECLPQRAPFAPTRLEGVPLDQRVRLTWRAPADTGGRLVRQYIVSKVKFVVGEELIFEQLPPTRNNATQLDITGLSNFVPYYFQVSAVNTLGPGPVSGRSSSLEPWIFPPGPPVNGRGFPGHQRVWLAWDLPRTDGGRAIEEFELWVTNSTGLARTPPVWWRLFLAPKGNVTTNELPAFPYSIFETSRRSSSSSAAAATSYNIFENSRRSHQLQDLPHSTARAFAAAAAEAEAAEREPKMMPQLESSSSPFPSPSSLLETTAPGSPLEEEERHAKEEERHAKTPLARATRGGLRMSAAAAGDALSLHFLVSGDADGNELQPTQEYSFRVRARNSYDVSRWSGVVAIQPTGEPPGAPMALAAQCHTAATPVSCSGGIVGDKQIELSWSPPLDDGGGEITGYVVMYGEYDTAMRDPAALKGLVVAVRAAGSARGHTITGLVNDVDYIVAVRAVNQYGNSSLALSGRFTPKFCEVEEGAICSECTQPFYKIWNGCQAPSCATPASPYYVEGSHTRLRGCAAGGCRLEIFYGTPELGQWGTVSFRSFTQTSAEVACRSLGLRARPQACGPDSAGCSGVNYPPAVPGSGEIWLEGVDCSGQVRSELLDIFFYFSASCFFFYFSPIRALYCLQVAVSPREQYIYIYIYIYIYRKQFEFPVIFLCVCACVCVRVCVCACVCARSFAGPKVLTSSRCRKPRSTTARLQCATGSPLASFWAAIGLF